MSRVREKERELVPLSLTFFLPMTPVPSELLIGHIWSSIHLRARNLIQFQRHIQQFFSLGALVCTVLHQAIFCTLHVLQRKKILYQWISNPQAQVAQIWHCIVYVCGISITSAQLHLCKCKGAESTSWRPAWGADWGPAVSRCHASTR